MTDVVRVEGLSELNRALRRADKDVRKGIRRELGSVAQPIAADAQALALSEIRGMQQSRSWAGMRIGLTSSLLYVAPRKRGVRGFGNRSRRRPNLAGLLMGRAMQPALNRNANKVEREFNDMLDRVADNFSR